MSIVAAVVPAPGKPVELRELDEPGIASGAMQSGPGT
jgi:hypothetical protein